MGRFRIAGISLPSPLLPPQAIKIKDLETTYGNLLRVPPSPTVFGFLFTPELPPHTRTKRELIEYFLKTFAL